MDAGGTPKKGDSSGAMLGSGYLKEAGLSGERLLQAERREAKRSAVQLAEGSFSASAVIVWLVNMGNAERNDGAEWLVEDLRRYGLLLPAGQNDDGSIRLRVRRCTPTTALALAGALALARVIRPEKELCEPLLTNVLAIPLLCCRCEGTWTGVGRVLSREEEREDAEQEQAMLAQQASGERVPYAVCGIRAMPLEVRG